MPPSCPCFAAAFDSHSDQLLGALQRRLCVVSTWKKNDSDPHCLPVHTFLLHCKVPPTFLYIAAVSNSHSHQLLGHLHPNTSVRALYAHFLELWQSAQSVLSSRFPAQILFTGRFFHSFFFAHFFCSALCHPRACAAVSASHSDQLLRTLHSTHPFLHYMLIFCSLCCLPSQSQRSDCLLKLCLEALLGAQSRVALPHRACFQPLLSGCTILPIISCSSFARFKYLEVHTGRDAASVFVWHFQKSTAF